MALEEDTTTQVQIKENQIYAPLVRGHNKWLKLTPEERVRQEYIQIVLRYHYGFSFDQMDQGVSVSNSKQGTGRARADVVIWRSAKEKTEHKKPLIVVECKAQQVGIREDDYYQGFNYASYIGAKFFVASNLKETKFFKVSDNHAQRLDEIVGIPNAQEILNEKKVQELLEKTKAFTCEEFSQLLFKCHNIIRNNDKLSPEAAFDEISKILFMKIRYERGQGVSRAIFSVERFEELKLVYAEAEGLNAPPFYQKIFDQAKEFYAEDNLFNKGESLHIRENSFLHIVKELEKYNLSYTSDDVKGIVFERFLGRTFRGELGQFFTPRTVVDYMVSVLDPEEGETICDPCCGSGGFLIRTFEYVRDKIEYHIQQMKERLKKETLPANFEELPEAEQNAITNRLNHMFEQLNKEFDINTPNGRLRELSYNCIFGTDTNPRMARAAKMNMIMHGDGYGGVHHHDGLLNVNGIFDGRFDVILTNPPFGVKIDKSALITENELPTDEAISKYIRRYGRDYESKVVGSLRKHLYRPILSLYETSKYSNFTEVLFLERALQLLRPGGRMGIVLPEIVLNHSPLQALREFIEGHARILNITSIPQDLFMASGATVKPYLVFLKKFTKTERANYLALVAEEEAVFDSAYASTRQRLEVNYNEALQVATKSKKDIKKKYKEELIKLEMQKVTAVRQAVKARLNYLVPIAEVKKIHINTEEEIKNEFRELATEFTAYRLKEALWTNHPETSEM